MRVLHNVIAFGTERPVEVVSVKRGRVAVYVACADKGQASEAYIILFTHNDPDIPSEGDCGKVTFTRADDGNGFWKWSGV